jgi:hypothetical protein
MLAYRSSASLAANVSPTKFRMVAEAALRSDVMQSSVLSSAEFDVYPQPDLARIRLALSVGRALMIENLKLKLVVLE